MNKFSITIFMALILSAFTAFGQKTDSVFNTSTYQWEPAQPEPPDIDSIAGAVLVDALTLWDYPESEFYKKFGFKKKNNTLKAKEGGTLIQIDLDIKEGYADVELKYSGWTGNWFFLRDTDEVWELSRTHYSNNAVPQIDEKINPMINGLHTAALKSELAFLEKMFGPLDSLQVGKIETGGDYHPNFAYEFSQDTINKVLLTLSNFAIKMVDTVMAKNSGANILYFEVQSKSIKGVTHINENGYELNSVNTQSTDTTFIITWGNVTLMPHPSEMEKLSEHSWMLQFFFPGDLGVLLSLSDESVVPDVIIFKGLDQIGSFVNGEWKSESYDDYMILDLQKIFLESKYLLPEK